MDSIFARQASISGLLRVAPSQTLTVPHHLIDDLLPPCIPALETLFPFNFRLEVSHLSPELKALCTGTEPDHWLMQNPKVMQVFRSIKDEVTDKGWDTTKWTFACPLPCISFQVTLRGQECDLDNKIREERDLLAIDVDSPVDVTTGYGTYNTITCQNRVKRTVTYKSLQRRWNKDPEMVTREQSVNLSCTAKHKIFVPERMFTRFRVVISPTKAQDLFRQPLPEKLMEIVQGYYGDGLPSAQPVFIRQGIGFRMATPIIAGRLLVDPKMTLVVGPKWCLRQTSTGDWKISENDFSTPVIV